MSLLRSAANLPSLQNGKCSLYMNNLFVTYIVITLDTSRADIRPARLIVNIIAKMVNVITYY